MASLPFFQVDAFTDTRFTGNPAAVMPLTEWLDDSTLQAIAIENNLSETAFTIPATGDADYELRWFTPGSEIRLCGHATLATAHVLLGDRTEIRFRTRQAGILSVSRNKDSYTMSLPIYTLKPHSLPEISRALGSVPVETLLIPSRYSVLVYADAATVRALKPDFAALRPAGDMLHIATAPGDGDYDVVSRVFAPGFGVDEDPVTGAAHAVIAPYWATRLGRNIFTAFQASARGGRLDCTVKGDRVILGGKCVTVIEGQFKI